MVKKMKAFMENGCPSVWVAKYSGDLQRWVLHNHQPRPVYEGTLGIMEASRCIRYDVEQEGRADSLHD